jgi:hypothetical protein
MFGRLATQAHGLRVLVEALLNRLQHVVMFPARDPSLLAGRERLKYHCTNEENGLKLRRYWTNACRNCALKPRCPIRAVVRDLMRDEKLMLASPDQQISLTDPDSRAR